MNHVTKKPIMVIAILAILLLTGCGGSKLKGVYKSQDMFAQTFIFDGDNVTMSAFGISATGPYEIKNGNIYIKYNLFGQDEIWEQSFYQEGKKIYIGGTEFKKE